ncbi:MAG: hypothetical protein KBS45_02175, partial [Clostridiales bacterium]|nr:hypothetical protein [Candidatus Coliplasma caballi]
MKRILAFVLAAMMVLACGAAMFVSADGATNVAPEATYEIHSLYQQQSVSPWGWSDNPADAKYIDDTGHDLTDGKHAENPAAYSDAAWVAMSTAHPDFNHEKPCYLIFKLKEATDVGTILVTVGNIGSSGIEETAAITAQGSADGVTYGEEVLGAYVDGIPAKETEGDYKIVLNENCSYVKLNFYSKKLVANAFAAVEAETREADWISALGEQYKGSSVGWMFFDEVQIFNDGVAKKAETWEDSYKVDEETGKASVAHPYGYVWDIDLFEGAVNETVSICATPSEGTGAGSNPTYCGCNPTWAITLLLKKLDDGTYEAVKDAIVSPGAGADAVVTIGEDEVAIIVHSASSCPADDEKYPNWKDKIVAMSTKAGDKFTIEGVDFEKKELKNAKLTALIPGAKPATVKEEITVDGKLDDTGWDDAKWITVNSENGVFQNKESDEASSTLNYKFQMRSDDEYLYVGAELGDPVKEGGNGNGTCIRLWLNNKEGATIFTDLLEISYKDGKVATCAKVNESLTTNSAKNYDASSLEAALTSDANKTYVEFKIKLDEIGAEESFNYFFQYSNKPEDRNDCLFYPAITFGEANRLEFFPYNKWDEATQATVKTADIALGEKEEPVTPPAPVDTYAEEIAAKVGEPEEDAKFDVVVKAEVGEDNKKVTVTISFENLKE